MNRNLLSAGAAMFLSIVFAASTAIKAQDLPGASSNLQTAPVGTIVIAMDNVNQACSSPTAGVYLFNLKSYGLAIAMLDISYKLKWVIKAGKAKDEIDFSANAERITPTYTAPQLLNFRAGPLLIFPPDTLGVDYAVKYFNASLPDSCKVKVYRLTTATTVDVRYHLTKPPKAALFNDSCDIHRNFMEMASVPTLNYRCISDASTLRSGCFTIATDPHTTISDLTTFDADSINNFLLSGGNFLGECEGIKTFESLKRFQSASGVMVDPSNGQSNQFNSNVLYENSDMAYAQYQGTYRPWTRGAIKVWTYNSATTNNFYPIVRCRRNADVIYQYSATVSKLTSDTGSVVFYLGNHEFFTHDCHTCNSGAAQNEGEVNGIRLYLNAVLVPSKFMRCVNVFEIPLSVTMGEFIVTKRTSNSSLLKWTSLNETDNAMYIIEHSINGNDFSVIGQVAGLGDSDNGFNYQFNHENVPQGINYYRLRMFSTTGKQTYSDTRMLVFGNKNQSLSIYPNPATGQTNLLLDANDGERVEVTLFDMAGKEIKKYLLTVAGQKTVLTINELVKGMYAVKVTKQNGEQLRGKLMVTY